MHWTYIVTRVRDRAQHKTLLCASISWASWIQKVELLCLRVLQKLSLCPLSIYTAPISDFASMFGKERGCTKWSYYIPCPSNRTNNKEKKSRQLSYQIIDKGVGRWDKCLVGESKGLPYTCHDMNTSMLWDRGNSNYINTPVTLTKYASHNYCKQTQVVWAYDNICENEIIDIWSPQPFL